MLILILAQAAHSRCDVYYAIFWLLTSLAVGFLEPWVMIIDYDTVDFKSQRQERTMLWKVPESHSLCREGSVPGECTEMWISSNRKYITLYSLKLYTREGIFMSRLGCLVGPK